MKILLFLLFLLCDINMRILGRSHVHDFQKKKMIVYDPKRKTKRLVYYEQRGFVKKILNKIPQYSKKHLSNRPLVKGINFFGTGKKVKRNLVLKKKF